MVDAIAGLLREHEDFALVLRVLAAQIASFRAGALPDYDVIGAGLDYFLSYPELSHHPKEDLIFDKLRAREAGIVEEIGNLRDAHQELAASARRFADGVQAVLEEAVVPRDAVLRWSTDFIDRQSEHMRIEESLVFPAAQHMLTIDDWREIAAQDSASADPLFGPQRETRFARLHHSILAWQKQDEQQALDAKTGGRA